MTMFVNFAKLERMAEIIKWNKYLAIINPFNSEDCYYDYKVSVPTYAYIKASVQYMFEKELRSPNANSFSKYSKLPEIGTSAFTQLMQWGNTQLRDLGVDCNALIGDKA